MSQKTLIGKSVGEIPIKLEDAERVANDVIQRLSSYYKRIEIVGSVRRRKSEVNDIDIVVIPKFGVPFSPFLLLPGARANRIGDKIIEIGYKGIQIDFYLADDNTFETLKLIRTGSAKHNVKLCTKARQKGMHLFANGQGLYKGVDKIADTEDGILLELLGEIIPPHKRE